MTKDLKLIQARVDRELYNDFKTKVKRYHQKNSQVAIRGFYEN